MKKLFFLLTLYSFCSFGEELNLIKIISEPQNKLVHDFILVLDENRDIVELKRAAGDDVQSFTPSDLNEEDVVLARAEGRDAVILSCLTCDSVHGGEITLKYLRNGLTMKYSNFFMDLKREGDEWMLLTKDGTLIETLRLKSRKLLGQLLGIRKVEVNR